MPFTLFRVHLLQNLSQKRNTIEQVAQELKHLAKMEQSRKDLDWYDRPHDAWLMV